MKVKINSLNILAHKNEFFASSLKYIEDYITKNGFDIINIDGSDQMYEYHSI
ncbi:MAG: hypothetical protein ACFFKA_02890 [Candidatus Thorarchaeota archaeon]